MGGGSKKMGSPKKRSQASVGSRPCRLAGYEHGDGWSTGGRACAPRVCARTRADTCADTCAGHVHRRGTRSMRLDGPTPDVDGPACGHGSRHVWVDVCAAVCHRHVYRHVFRHVFRHVLRHAFRHAFRHVCRHMCRQVYRHVYQLTSAAAGRAPDPIPHDISIACNAPGHTAFADPKGHTHQ